MSRTKCPSCETRYNRPATTIGDHCMVCKGGIIVRDNDELALRLEELSQLSLKMEDILSDIGDFDPDYIVSDIKDDIEAVTAKIQDALDDLETKKLAHEEEGDCFCDDCDPKADKLYAALTDPNEHDEGCQCAKCHEDDCCCDECDPLHEKLLEDVVGPDSPMLLKNMGQDDDEKKDHCTLDLNDLYNPDKTDEPDQELGSESHL